jgi:hypothetical protein
MLFCSAQQSGLAEEYHRYYKDGILEVTIDIEIYNRTFKPLERPYQGGELIELPIPQDLFSILNQYPKVLKSR